VANLRRELDYLSHSWVTSLTRLTIPIPMGTASRGLPVSLTDQKETIPTGEVQNSLGVLFSETNSGPSLAMPQLEEAGEKLTIILDLLHAEARAEKLRDLNRRASTL